MELNEAQVRGLMLMAACHAPTYQEAERVVEKVLADYNDESSIARAIIDSLGDKT